VRFIERTVSFGTKRAICPVSDILAREFVDPTLTTSTVVGNRMNMPPTIRKLALTAHVTSSLGWLGAVAAFLVLSIAGLKSRDSETVRSAYLAMDVIGRYVIVPLSLAGLVTGVVQSLGTPWGLLRHYWIVTKLVLTFGATALLLLHQFTAVAGAARQVASSAPGTMPDVGRWGGQLVGDATAALVVLIAITVIAVFKPWGLTSYGRRKQGGTPARAGAATVRPGLPLSLKFLLVAVALLLLVFAALHHGSHVHHGH
jgi:hypothetical protein